MQFYNHLGMIVELEGNERNELYFVAPVHRVNFSEAEWSHLENRDYQFVFSLYPEKRFVKVKFIS